MRVQVTQHYPQAPETVYAYMSDPRNMPAWNSAVASVEPLDGGTRYVMRRDLPSGAAVNELDVVSSAAPFALTIRTLTGPTPFTYHYTLESAGGGTTLRLDGEVELGSVIALAGPLATRFVERSIAANFATLGLILGAR